MTEYEFPSGREVQLLAVGDWTWPLHVGLTAIVLVSVLVLVWRVRRPASGWDIPVWIAGLIGEWNLARWINFHFVRSEVDVFIYFLFMLLVVVVAIIITAWRSVQPRALRFGIVFLICTGIAVILILPAIQQAREAARRTQCKNDLKLIGLATQNYVDIYRQFPFAGRVISDSEQVCSWRVAIWPYLESIPVHNYYHYEEPWNSPFNLKCLDLHRSYNPWRCPSHEPRKRFTDYSMLTGPGTIGGDGVTAVKPNDVTDGASNTIFFVEACGREILWTEPIDAEVTEASLGVNLPGDQPGRSRGIISSYHVGGAHVVLGSGEVRFVSEKIDKTVLKALTTINGGETVPAEW